MFREMQEEVERQRLSTPEKRPGTAPFSWHRPIWGVATDGDEDFHYDGRPRTAGVMTEPGTGPRGLPVLLQLLDGEGHDHANAAVAA